MGEGPGVRSGVGWRLFVKHVPSPHEAGGDVKEGKVKKKGMPKHSIFTVREEPHIPLAIEGEGTRG